MHARFIRQLLHGRHVTVGQIHYVDVVAHAGAVFGRVVVAKNRQRLATAYRYLGDIRHQVVRNALRIFTHVARRMGADRVEVAQQGDAPLRLRFLQIGQDLLHHQLAFAVRALRRPGREAFNVRDFRLIAVDGGGGAKDEVFDVGRAHGGDETQGTVDVVVVILERLRNGFTDRFQTREVDHRFDGVVVKDLGHQRFIADVAFHEGGLFTAKAFNHRQHAALAVAQVVENDDVMTVLQQLHTGMTSYVTATTCYQNSHNSLHWAYGM